MFRFKDRVQAGQYLADKLLQYANAPDAVVLGLPRGGVVVASEVARTLGLPLDVFLVRKLGVPEYEELAMGAIASGGVRVMNEDVLRQISISDRYPSRPLHEGRSRNSGGGRRRIVGTALAST